MHSKKVILYFKTSQVQRKSAGNVSTGKQASVGGKSAGNVSRGKQASVGENVLVTSVGVNKRQWGQKSAGKRRQAPVGSNKCQ